LLFSIPQKDGNDRPCIDYDYNQY